MKISTHAQLRSLYGEARERSVRKQMAALDPHALRFIALSPFVVLASCNALGTQDASPRGGPPGFVRVRDPQTLLLPDSPGNNRLDTLQNIIDTGRIGLLFLIPGIDETLRVNGSASLTTDEATLALFAEERRPPKLVIEIGVSEVYLHCAKAFMRSALWSPAAQVDRAVMPSMGEMMKDQIGGDMVTETQEQMLARYAQDL